MQSAVGDITGLLGALTVLSSVRPLARALVATEAFLMKVRVATAACLLAVPQLQSSKSSTRGGTWRGPACMSSSRPAGCYTVSSKSEPHTKPSLCLCQVMPDGRTFAHMSVLGGAFSLSILTDREGRPAVASARQQYLTNMESRSPAEINSVVSSLRLTLGQLATSLHGIVLNLLKKARPCLSPSLLYSSSSVYTHTHTRTLAHTLASQCSGGAPVAEWALLRLHTGYAGAHAAVAVLGGGVQCRARQDDAGLEDRRT